ncbi:MAG: sulfite exporter TauE/SafE family protein [Actinobacteria bacterium]|nr:sulfite exporter TauE/SafE family protein [Actinomycetota bacterium]
MWTLLLVSFAGFIAQMIDGAMGMAFGVISTTVLISLAYSPAAASAIVHFAKIATGAVSGAAHIKYGNVDWHATIKVALPGGIGAFVGAIVLSSIDLRAAIPWTSSILLMMGLVVLYRFSRRTILGRKRRARARWLAPLGLVGGFVDSTGGGGWGPIVTTSLTASNALEPRKAIGSTNTAELVVAVASSLGFLLGLGAKQLPWTAILALVVGGTLAAPIAAWLVKNAPQRILGVFVGGLIILLNVRQLLVLFDPPTIFVITGYGIAIALWLAGLIQAFRLLPEDHAAAKTA